MNPFEIIRAEAANFPVTLPCSLLEVSTSGYYAFLGRGRSTREHTDLRVTTKIRAIHASTRSVYGSRRNLQKLLEKGMVDAPKVVQPVFKQLKQSLDEAIETVNGGWGEADNPQAWPLRKGLHSRTSGKADRCRAAESARAYGEAWMPHLRHQGSSDKKWQRRG